MKDGMEQLKSMKYYDDISRMPRTHSDWSVDTESFDKSQARWANNESPKFSEPEWLEDFSAGDVDDVMMPLERLI